MALKFISKGGMYVRVEKFKGGFTTYFQDHTVSKVVSYYDKTCVIHYTDGSQRTIELTGKDVVDVYNSQFGVPVSDDGSKLFLSSWENGLAAFDTGTNAVLWRYKRSRITKVFIFPDYLVTKRRYESILKFDIDTGELLGMVKSGTLERMFHLVGQYVLVDSYRGKLSIIDTENMTVVKQFPQKLINPFECLSFVIREAEFKENKVIIRGFEGMPRKEFIPELNLMMTSSDFERELDFDLSV